MHGVGMKLYGRNGRVPRIVGVDPLWFTAIAPHLLEESRRMEGLLKSSSLYVCS